MTTEQEVSLAWTGAKFAARRDNGRTEAAEHLGVAWERVRRVLSADPSTPPAHVAVKAGSAACDSLRTERGWKRKTAVTKPLCFSDLPDAEFGDEPIDPPARAAESAPLTREESERLWRAVAELIPNRMERMAVELRFRHGLTTEATAAVFRVCETRVFALTEAGLGRLRAAAAFRRFEP